MKIIGVVFAIMLAALVVALFFGGVALREFDEECEAIGGVVKNLHRSKLCLSADGRVLR